MLPAVALVGRPNVGKSTLFNQLTKSRDALVADQPGMTRDRRYGLARADKRNYIVIDTGGLGGDAPGVIESGVLRQVDLALEEANVIVFVVDCRAGLTAADLRIAESLRRSGKPIVVASNKSEGLAPEIAEVDFHQLGLGAPVGISALHSKGLQALQAKILEPFADLPEEDTLPDAAGPKLAVVGRPNVGKSTLINRLLGTERMITSPEPGTTRDSVLVPCERDGYSFVLIDTAGIRRRARVSETTEKFSIVQSLQAIEDAGVVVLLLDAREGLTDQDLHLIGLVVARGRALVVGVNKWDGMDGAARRQVEAQLDRQLDFVPFASVHYLSALHGSGISEVVRSAMKAYESAGRSLPTPLLNQLLSRALEAHPPPMVRGRQVRLRYAHQGGRYPPLIIVHGSQAERIPERYRRYLENSFRQWLKLKGTPVKVEFKTGENPFAGRRNTLTPRQEKRRKRVIQHARRGR
jgi:GTP-binding protein